MENQCCVTILCKPCIRFVSLHKQFTFGRCIAQREAHVAAILLEPQVLWSQYFSRCFARHSTMPVTKALWWRHIVIAITISIGDGSYVHCPHWGCIRCGSNGCNTVCKTPALLGTTCFLSRIKSFWMKTPSYINSLIKPFHNWFHWRSHLIDYISPQSISQLW